MTKIKENTLKDTKYIKYKNFFFYIKFYKDTAHKVYNLL